jgi:hypothetical protein
VLVYIRDAVAGEDRFSFSLAIQKSHAEVYSSWSTHVRSWTRNPHPAILVMRYEDMIADSVKSFGAFTRHFLLHPTPAELADAIERSSFDKLQAQEEEAAFASGRKSPSVFSAKAVPGNGRKFLRPRKSTASCEITAKRCSASIICRFDRCAPAMQPEA